MDWSIFKAFDCVPHDLRIAKSEPYGFHIHALKLIQDYLSNRKQELKLKMHIAPQPAITCSRLTIKTQEQGVE